MSLVKQLWVAIALVMVMAFGISIVISTLSARHYLEQQLQLKNIDNATALALSLTQMPKDEVMIDLQVAAQFDAGHYRFIRIVSPDGKTLVEKVAAHAASGAPDWFVRLIPIHAEPGQALIQNGWIQFGTLTLASQDVFVYKSLWDGVIDLAVWFALGGLRTGLVGTQAIRLITRPLRHVVQQAHAITERRFITMKEPRTPELRSVAKAMNDMVQRLKVMFAEETARLDALRKRVNRDEVTGLFSREYFLSHLREVLQDDQAGASGSLVMVRLPDLNTLNTTLGRQQTDALLKATASALFASGRSNAGQRIGRIKGAEFAIVCPTFEHASAAATAIFESLQQHVTAAWGAQVPDLFHVGAVRYHRHQELRELLSGADEALARAADKGQNSWYATEDGQSKNPVPAEQWRALLSNAATNEQLSLFFYPVLSGEGQNILHVEGVIRLKTDATGTLLCAGDFMPMAAQLNLTALIDLCVVKLALAHLQTNAGDVAINLSAQTISDFHFRNQLAQLLKTQPQLCGRLLFEVPEYGVMKQFDAFCDLARVLKELGCRVGIEYFGQHFAQSSQLAELGLDYIKVHPSYTNALADNPGNQEFLKGLCRMSHTFGITVLALGVTKREDLPLLASLGFDGATGPGVTSA